MSKIKALVFAFVLFAAALNAQARSTTHLEQLQVFQFASATEGAEILGKEDEYVQATQPLERKAKLRTEREVNISDFLVHMRSSSKDWKEEEKRRLLPHLLQMEKFMAQLAWATPERIILIRAKAQLEDNLPHTRAHAIILPDSYFGARKAPFDWPELLAHELFHVLSRQHPQLREKTYQIFGFEKCSRVELDAQIKAQLITNPDAPTNEHSITLMQKNATRHYLPSIIFPKSNINPKNGFIDQLLVYWLEIERDAQGICKSSQGQWLPVGSTPEKLESLEKTIGKNSDYYFHPEEIAADNFAMLYLLEIRQMKRHEIPTPEKIEQLRTLILN